MKIKLNEFSEFIRNCEPNEFLRECIGGGLCRLLYDSANVDEYEDEYKALGEASFYNSPSEDDIFKCLDYLEEADRMDEEIEIFLF